MREDLIRRSDAIKAVLGITMYEARVPIDTVIYNIKSVPSADRPQLAKDIVEPINNGNAIMSEDTYEDLLDRPQGRYIDADALVTVYLYDHEHEDDYTQCMSVGKCLDLLTEEGCPKTVDRQQEWIPCTEKLPSKGVAVLVNGTMYDAPPITISTDAPYYYEQGWINAWMPLPEPWKGADDEESV